MIMTHSLVRPSALSRERSGKALSTGWVVNFAVGCTHGCRFCYVARIVESLNPYRLPPSAFKGGWGSYIYVPENLAELIKRTPWRRWRGETILMSSTHDPYLPELYFPHKWPRRILEAALPHDVKFTVLTRSALPLQDLDLYTRYRDQILLMASIPTLNRSITDRTEPKAPPPQARLAVLRKAKEAGVRVGVVVAPIIPLDGWERELEELFQALAELKPDVIYGEILHLRGKNVQMLREAGVEPITGPKLDLAVGRRFEQLLAQYGLKGEYWYEWRGSGQTSPPSRGGEVNR
jgi:DNA repair photolyase